MEDVKKLFIVDEKEFDIKNTEKFIRKIADFVKVGKDGSIFLEIESINKTDKIQLAIVARFLANKIDKNILQEVSLPEIMQFLSLPQNTATARISELVKGRNIRRIKVGKYVAVPHQIEKFIEKINKKYGEKHE